MQKGLKELVEINAFSVIEGRKLKCDVLHNDQKIYDECFKGLSTLIVRQSHKPAVAYHRLRNKHI